MVDSFFLSHKVKSVGLTFKTKNVFMAFLRFGSGNLLIYIYENSGDINKPAMYHGDDSDNWVFYHGSIVKIGPIKMKGHIQSPI